MNVSPVGQSFSPYQPGGGGAPGYQNAGAPIQKEASRATGADFSGLAMSPMSAGPCPEGPASGGGMPPMSAGYTKTGAPSNQGFNGAPPMDFFA